MSKIIHEQNEIFNRNINNKKEPNKNPGAEKKQQMNTAKNTTEYPQQSRPNGKQNK